MSIKISKIGYFPFTFKLNEKKMPLKKLVWKVTVTEGERGGGGGGGLIFNRGWKYFKKRGEGTRKWWRKNRGGL